MKPKEWKKLGKRLLRLEPAELKERLRQEVAKRQDGLLHFLGFDFARPQLNARNSGAAAFFFGPQSVEPILDLLRARLPGYGDRIVSQADKACQHRFNLLGYSDLEYGGPIDWHLDAVHNKRAPRKLFYRVRYLDFAEAGDCKVTWEINRHQHLPTLAKAYRLTGDLRYVDEILRQWRDWRAANPYPVGMNWASSLEVAFRSLAWFWTYHLLAGAPRIPEIRREWLRGFALHGRHIERYLSTYFSPNTHLLGEGVGLFFLGVLCPELKSARRWQSLGWEIVLREAQRQVRADGFHFEQSTYYHVYALDFLLHSAVLASLNGIPVPKELEDTLERMLNVLCQLACGGLPPSFGDDDGGRLFDGQRNRRKHLLDPLATGAVLFERGDFKYIAGNLREETVWLLGVEGVRKWDEIAIRRPESDSKIPNGSGFYPLTAEKPICQLVVDAGPLGAASGGHGHADALSVCLECQGHSLLVDPGTCEYTGPDSDRDYFRSTAMHNTVLLDSKNQSEPASAFSWKWLTRSTVEQWIQGKSFDVLSATHDGYQHLSQPMVHRRQVVNLRNGVYLVRDLLEGQGRHQVDISWHLGPELEIDADNVFRGRSNSVGLALLAAEGHGWAQEVRKAVWSPVYGQKAPMTVLNFGLASEVPVEFATLLVTLERVARPGVFLHVKSDAQESSVEAYRYESASSTTWFFFRGAPNRWRVGKVSSDAQFACWRQGEVEQLLWFCNGTFASVEGGLELRLRRNVAWAQATSAGEDIRLFSSDAGAFVEDFAPSKPPAGTTTPNL